MDVPERTVVVVHGIGQQVAGATATAWAESFVRFCEAQGRRAEVVETNDDAAFRLVLADGAPGTLRDAVVAEPVLRLRIVEARWAEAFEAPTALSVLRWLLWYGPNLAFAQVFLTRRAHRWLRAATEHRIAETGTAAELTTGDAAAHRAASSTTSLGPVLYLLGGLVLLLVVGATSVRALGHTPSPGTCAGSAGSTCGHRSTPCTTAVRSPRRAATTSARRFRGAWCSCSTTSTTRRTGTSPSRACSRT